MNENIDLTKILKNCPIGWKFYSSVYDNVTFLTIDNSPYPIKIIKDNREFGVSKDGKHIKDIGECTFFPSKEQRDWSKFTAPWYKKERFDPNTLQPFDKVLVRDTDCQNWTCGFFSHINVFNNIHKYNVGELLYKYCIPYSDDTKHLVGTTEEAPEYYRYWED